MCIWKEYSRNISRVEGIPIFLPNIHTLLLSHVYNIVCVVDLLTSYDTVVEAFFKQADR